MGKSGMTVKIKIPKGNAFLFISFVAISICFIMIASAVHSQKIIYLSKNSLYTGHEIPFSIYDARDNNLWEKVIPKLSDEYDDYAIYLPVEESEFLLRGAYIKGRVSAPPMVWGKFFDEHTAWSETPLMVVGISHKDEIEYIDNKYYYSYNGTKYEVIGIMGLEKDSRINDMIFIDFKSALGISDINTQYVLDTRGKGYIKNIGDKLEDLVSGKADCVIALPGDSHEGLAAMLISKGIIMDVLYVFVLICFSLCTVLVTDMWLKFRGQFLFVMQLCGYKKCFKIIEIFKRYCTITISGYIVSIFIAMILSYFISDISIHPVDAIIALALSVGLGTIILSVLYIRWMMTSSSIGGK